MDNVIGKFVISSAEKTKWTLTNESKKIDDYLCFKATSTYTVVNTVNTFTFPIIAWYCPQIPINIGPKGYAGLPGLIVELQERSFVYGLKSISYDSKPRTIEKPNKGRKLTKFEFENLEMSSFKD